jgi:hypothetical protein
MLRTSTQRLEAMTAQLAQRAVLALLRTLLEAVPSSERSALLMDLSSACLALLKEHQSPSGLFRMDLPPPDDSSGEKNGE